MEYGNALKLIGGLSNTDKMPWWSWSISAKDCITGSKLAAQPNTVCSGCYALKGRYLFPNVMDAHSRRKASIEHPDFVEAFVVVLTSLHAKTRKRKDNGDIENRFRWMDSGDIQSVDMLRNINLVAERTPQILHWLPTRELKIVREYQKIYGAFASNLVVRISEAKVGVKPNRQPLDLPFSTVGHGPGDNLHVCPAMSLQGNRCLNCDTCWTNKNVDYPLH